MLFSRAWQNGVRILVHLARLEPGEHARAAGIAEALDIPAPFTGKLLTALANGRLIRSKRGPGGGVMLARPARDITLSDVAATFGESGAMDGCVLGLPSCSDRDPCAVHQVWGPLRDAIQRDLLARSIAALEKELSD